MIAVQQAYICITGQWPERLSEMFSVVLCYKDVIELNSTDAAIMMVSQ